MFIIVVECFTDIMDFLHLIQLLENSSIKKTFSLFNEVVS